MNWSDFRMQYQMKSIVNVLTLSVNEFTSFEDKEDELKKLMTELEKNKARTVFLMKTKTISARGNSLKDLMMTVTQHQSKQVIMQQKYVIKILLVCSYDTVVVFDNFYRKLLNKKYFLMNNSMMPQHDGVFWY